MPHTLPYTHRMDCLQSMHRRARPSRYEIRGNQLLLVQRRRSRSVALLPLGLAGGRSASPIMSTLGIVANLDGPLGGTRRSLVSRSMSRNSPAALATLPYLLPALQQGASK